MLDSEIIATYGMMIMWWLYETDEYDAAENGFLRRLTTARLRLHNG